MRQRISVSNLNVTDIPIGGDKNGVGATCYSRVTQGPDKGLFIMPEDVAKLVVDEPHESWGEVALVGEPEDDSINAKG